MDACLLLVRPRLPGLGLYAGSQQARTSTRRIELTTTVPSPFLLKLGDYVPAMVDCGEIPGKHCHSACSPVTVGQCRSLKKGLSTKPPPPSRPLVLKRANRSTAAFCDDG